MTTLPVKLIPFATLFKREVARFLRIWGQTILAPIVTTSLYLLIFGVSLGRTIDMHAELTYLEFIVPGLIMMGIINSASSSISFSIFLSKIQGVIVDVLVAPLGGVAMTFAYALAGTLRGMLVGTVIFFVSIFFGTSVPVSPILALCVALFSAWIFTCIGTLVGIAARQFEHINIFTTFLLLPLIYLGGVFYSLSILPPFWQTVSRVNPLFYMIDSFRYAFLGIADGSPLVSLAVILGVAFALTGTLIVVFRRGYGLRT